MYELLSPSRLCAVREGRSKDGIPDHVASVMPSFSVSFLSFARGRTSAQEWERVSSCLFQQVDVQGHAQDDEGGGYALIPIEVNQYP